MALLARPSPATKSALLLRDSLTFLALLAATVVLFGVTHLLFGSFEEHRQVLGRSWSERGRAALAAGRPEEAVADLRTALSFEPDARADQLALAEALAGAGHIEEATNYFLNLWETSPGDGLLNLQLARLARRATDPGKAIDFYRASIVGTWQGDGVERRRTVRLELADYLMSRGNLPAARAELLIGAGNAPQDRELQAFFGDKLAAAGDLRDALHCYKEALAVDPHGRDTLERILLEKAGRLSFQLGEYGPAYKLLSAALALPQPAIRNTRETGSDATAVQEQASQGALEALAAAAHRAPQLSLSRDLPAEERAAHLVLAGGIAQRRLASCAATLTASQGILAQAQRDARNQPGGALNGLQAQWTAARKSLRAGVLQGDAAAADHVAELIGATEGQAAEVCGVPTGDDALLLTLLSAGQGGGA